MKRVLTNGYIVTMEADKIIESGYIVIEDDKISEVGEGTYNGEITNITDCSGKIIIPSFVNTHVHLMQQLGRGIADDVHLLTWLNDRIWPYESSMTDEQAYLSAYACICELLKSGVTCFLEAGGDHVDMMHKAVKELNVNAVLTYNILDNGDGLPQSWIKDSEDLIAIQRDLINKFTDEDVQIALGLRTIFNCSEEMYLKTKKLQDETNALLTTHILEVAEEREFSLQKYGISTVEMLHKHGLLNDKLIGAHCVHYSAKDIDLYNSNKSYVSYNPAAAMKVCLGFAPLEKIDNELLTIGTDGAPSNNKMDIMRDMYLTALLTKGKTLDPTVLTAYTVLKAATINGAKALKVDDKLGSIKENKLANLNIIALDDIQTTPVYYPINNLIYSADSKNISEVILKGQTVVKNNKLVNVDEKELVSKINAASEEIKQKIFK